MSIIRAPYERRSREIDVVQSRQGITERTVLFGVMLGSAVLPALHLATGLLDFANYTAPVWIVFLGVLSYALGIWLFWRSHKDLDRNWSASLEVRESHTLITHGVYQQIRHPMYSAIILMFLAQALFIANWLAGLSGLAAFAALYLTRVDQEERMLTEQFGDAYREYCRVSGRLIPKLGARLET